MHYADPSSSRFTRWAAKRTDRLIAVSEYVRGEIARTAPDLAARVETVRNGVDAEHFVPGAGRGGSGGDAPFSAAIVCRLTGWKRVELAVLASALARVPLVVVGDGEERRRLEEVARARCAPVRFVGFQDDPRPFVAACDVTLNTSKAEAFSLSVLESLAMERPVIAFAKGGIPEIVVDDVTGWLVGDESPEALADALRRAKAERVRLPAMGAAGRRFVEARTSARRMCEGYAVQYEALWRRGRVEGA
jgi:glycosyltransferase involved in cell wall biosynthesis